MSELEEIEKKIDADIVYNQHYVPRCYLRAWLGGNGKLECYDKSNTRTFYPSVENVANEHYFYTAASLTKEQMTFLYDMWIADTQDPLKSLLMGWIKCFSLKDALMAFCKQVNWNAAANWYEKNTEEKFYSIIEGKIPIWREKLESFDSTYWSDEDNEIEFIFWIVLQFIRTPLMQDKYIEAAKKAGGELEKLSLNTQNVYRLIFATRFAHNIIMSDDMKIFPFVNKTGIQFITSDQPVVNVCASYKPLGELSYYDLELYYPISPEIAVLISPKDCYTKWRSIELNQGQVNAYNQVIEKMSKRFIFRKP
ncbi:DUF4238 domain-containing protein [Fibrobacter sp.]|uniref:DUF4238 domain-containing protein n=1 Tax=Fibrobacter sp. TaxID=35828 RepID=UPI003866B96C